MANSKYAYVRDFELPDPLLPGTFMLLRLDGHSFHRFSDQHEFAKPNDVRALELMDRAARAIMEEYPDIVLAFGESDEYSFLLQKSTSLYNRRQSKILSTLTSLFTSAYVFHWRDYFPDTPLRYPPSFDGRIVLYPTERYVRDYFAWRQADTHINNLYNTTFWALVQQGGQTTTKAHTTLKGTLSKEKHEILFSQFGINYSKIEERFRKGSVLVREEVLVGEEPSTTSDPIPIPTPAPTPAQDEKDPSNVHTETETETADPPNSPPLPQPQEPVNAMQNTEAPTAKQEKEKAKEKAKEKGKGKPKGKQQRQYRITLMHCDIIKDEFWEARPGVFGE